MNRQTPQSQAGFTLIEIIVTLMLVSVVGVVVFQFFGSSFIGSTTPATRLRNAFDLHQAMEEMTEEYLAMTKSDDAVSTAELVTLKTDIGGDKVYGDGEQPDTEGNNDILMVTIRRDTGESLTTLFTTR